MISFTLPIAPVAKGRPRISRGHAYTPAKTRRYERELVCLARHAYRDVPLTGPIGLSLVFVLPRPKSAPKRVSWPAVRPDLDNYVKAVKDALNGILYGDDGQVCILAAYKQYGVPCVQVSAWSLEQGVISIAPTLQKSNLTNEKAPPLNGHPGVNTHDR